MSGIKHDTGKPKTGQVMQGFSRALSAIGQLGTVGAEEYGMTNFIQVEDGYNRYTDALMRHFLQEKIEEKDIKTGLPHQIAVCWNALARLELYLKERESSGE